MTPELLHSGTTFILFSLSRSGSRIGTNETARFSTQLKQVLSPSSVTAATGTNFTAIYSLPFTFCAPQISLKPILSSSTDQFSNCSIIPLVLAFIAFQKWGSFSSFFLASSIGTLPFTDTMIDHFPEGTVFFLEWPIWARLAIVSCLALRGWVRSVLTDSLARS